MTGGTQVQQVIHMFGPPTVKRALRLGDFVLALADHGEWRVAVVCVSTDCMLCGCSVCQY